ncbi:DUF3667 domain-containing protein [Flavobacterium sp.]|uniref:DUF3667 domain-containing protein n=1 Tax=Flavobacterium sp. TaxID=239 RepID=UPI0026380B76|nr:DUF3667 domain-containing protein [Flavobacterium sp.]
MGHGRLREDKTCENCGYIVDKSYCSQCGQKNVETRQTFGALVAHFIEDFTHYDGAFWKTIKYLLFYPGRLTKEYLSGKRQKFVPPVKLYIFISFVTFFIAVSSVDDEGSDPSPEGTKANTEERYYLPINNKKIYTPQQLDSIHKTLPEDEKFNAFELWFEKKQLEKGRQLGEIDSSKKGFAKEFIPMLPKVLFIYLPIFAFWLWVFHGKTRWYYFDHGIFTLHIFSFYLLLLTLLKITATTIDFILNSEISDIINGILYIAAFFYSIYYLFKSRYNFYKEKIGMSLLKSFLLLLINIFCFFILFVIAAMYASYKI